MENKRKEYKANVNLEIYFNDSDLAYCKDLCEIKLRMILKMVEDLFDKESICCLIQSYEITEDEDDLEVYCDKVSKNEENLGVKDDMKISGDMINLLIEALGNRFNNNFKKDDKRRVKAENDEILKIIRGLIDED